MPGETGLLKMPFAEEKDERAAFPIAVDSPRAKLLDETILAAKLGEHSASFTVKVGELAVVTGVGVTATLPPAALNATVGVFSAGGTTKVSGGKIYGDFVAGAESIELLTNQHVILRANGTRWFIVDGEPKRENKYHARAALFSAETLSGSGTSTWANPSSTREAMANFDFELQAESLRGCIVNFYVGGELVQNFFTNENVGGVRMGTSALLAPGESVEFELLGGGSVKLAGIHVSYRVR